MLTIFTDSHILDDHWLPMIDFQESYTICHSLTDYINASGRKIAFTTYQMQQDYPNPVASFEDLVNQLSQHSEKVFCFDRELSLHYFNIWRQCTGNNIYWLTPGIINETVSANIIFWGDWFTTSTALYKSLPDILPTINPYAQKSKYFDALLGLKKPNRTFVYNSVNEHNLHNQIIMTYNVDRRVQPETGRYDYTDDFYAQDYFIWEPNTVVNYPIRETANFVQYQGQTTRLSQIIPIEVYNNTAYSIVAETDFRNEHSFYTEKTAKAIMARRLFVAFSGRNFLQNLRSLGFKTFNGIIDESYDNIPLAEERWTQAFDQVRYLCGCDQAEIYAKIKPIAEHNYNLIMNENWDKLAADKITKVLC